MNILIKNCECEVAWFHPGSLSIILTDKLCAKLDISLEAQIFKEQRMTE